ncbi:hypothetical protein LZC95_22780 [Pendulispora brunnea]|uniref:Uncharacterized protein n=1 Tax=Pendulispora brunnea TaxID=2905690 RepID=A0ABZ2KLU4_9BACT
MASGLSASWMLAQEARALLNRLSRIKSFALQETMVPAAALGVEAQAAIERHLSRGVRRMRNRVLEYLDWLEGPEGARATPSECQRRFTFVRLRFNAVLSHVDIFSEALSQRSEAETGVWLSGLDVVCRDALALPGYIDPPPVICYLARGPGAAIRRARTRLPGGEENPIAIVRLPRERMISSSLASSLVHEVGHQGAALLGLVPSLRKELRETPPPAGTSAETWRLWSRWISEIVADLWSIAKVGITSTAGLMGVVSLPPPFVFRINPDDPHPTPYLRVKLSAAIGNALYPHSGWHDLDELWTSLYPTDRLDGSRREIFAAVEQCMPEFVGLLVHHCPPALRGKSLKDVLATEERCPDRLATFLRTWRGTPSRLLRAPPTLAFAVIGQARVRGAITPEREGDLLAKLLRHWAWRSTVDAGEVCAGIKSNGAGAVVRETARFPEQAIR